MDAVAGLFIGSYGAACNLPALQECKITHILCVSPTLPLKYALTLTGQYYGDSHRVRPVFPMPSPTVSSLSWTSPQPRLQRTLTKRSPSSRGTRDPMPDQETQIDLL